MRTHSRMLMLALVLVAVCAASVASAQNTDYSFRWRASTRLEDGRAYLPKELQYQVFVKRGNDAEEYLTTVEDTTYVFSAEPGVVQRIRVMAVDQFGTESTKSEWSDPIFFTEGGGGPTALPPQAQLRPNYPNPFNPQTAIRYGIPADVGSGDRAQLDIYTLQGQLVRTFDVDRTPGWHEVIWDGTDQQGMPTAAGMYMTRLVVGTMVQTNKMTMVK